MATPPLPLGMQRLCARVWKLGCCETYSSKNPPLMTFAHFLFCNKVKTRYLSYQNKLNNKVYDKKTLYVMHITIHQPFYLTILEP